ncbi:MAG TPA: hypothetical protein VFG52_00885 [Xanthomonadales bacterium]|nr:hypothetical protein [Xanthomonadales bacterium]
MSLANKFSGSRVFLAVSLAIGPAPGLLAASGPESGNTDTDIADLTPGDLAWEQWGNAAWLHMADSETLWIRAALATHLATRKDPGLSAIGHERFEAIAPVPTTDPLTLWHLGRYCSAFRQSSTCEEQQIIERLGQADPSNLAALLVVDQHRSGEQWTTLDTQSPTNQNLLKSMAAAERYDEYWGRGSSELLDALEEYSQQNPPPAITELLSATGYDPSLIFLFPIPSMEGFSPGYSKLFKLCETLAEAGEPSAIRDCLTIAHTLQYNSKTTLAGNMGITLELNVQSAIDPDSAATLLAARKRAITRHSGTCAIPKLMQGGHKVDLESETLAALSSAWLREVDTLGEVQAMQRAAEREYALYPDEFSSNPADCPDVRAMSNMEMVEYLGSDDPARQQDGLR